MAELPHPPKPRTGVNDCAAYLRQARAFYVSRQSDRHFRERHDDAGADERGVSAEGREVRPGTARSARNVMKDPLQELLVSAEEMFAGTIASRYTRSLIPTVH